MSNIIEGKIEIMTKFSSLPEATIDEKAKTRSFQISNGKFNICITLPEKMWKRIAEGAEKFESWVCALNGKIKKIDGNNIFLDEPAAQVFENQKKPKEATPQPQQQQKKHPQHGNHQAKKELEIKNI